MSSIPRLACVLVPWLALGCSSPAPSPQPTPVTEAVVQEEPRSLEESSELSPEAERHRFLALRSLHVAEEHARATRYRECQRILLQVANAHSNDPVVTQELERVSRVYGLRSGLPYSRSGVAIERELLVDEIQREALLFAVAKARQAVEMQRWEDAYQALAEVRVLVGSGGMDDQLALELEDLGARLPRH